MNINGRKVVCRKNEGALESVKKVTLKEFSEIIYDIESIKDKMLDVDPNLENCIITHQNIKKMLPSLF